MPAGGAQRFSVRDVFESNVYYILKISDPKLGPTSAAVLCKSLSVVIPLTYVCTVMICVESNVSSQYKHTHSFHLDISTFLNEQFKMDTCMLSTK